MSSQKDNGPLDGARLIAAGWDQYARHWTGDKFRVVESRRVEFLGDEWSGECVIDGEGTSYGVTQEQQDHFEEFLDREIISRYLPLPAEQGMEIGPGGGRVTQLLLPRTSLLHAVDVSEDMFTHLRERLGPTPSLITHLTDGLSLPPIPQSSLDYCVAFDVFVHFEPRLIFWYLRQIEALLRPGGIGVIHYSNILTALGWEQFENDLDANVRGRSTFFAFGVMCEPIMLRFLHALSLEVVATPCVITRDAIVVFRKPVLTAPL